MSVVPWVRLCYNDKKHKEAFSMKIGYSRIDITPTQPVPLAGYGNTSRRISQNVLSPLCSACIVLTDEAGSTAMLIHNDLISSPDWFADPIRQAIEEATGVPFENIVIHATHTHSAPDIGNKAEPGIPPYIEMVKQKLVENAVAAMEDRKLVTSAEMAKAYTKGLNFVRHYVLEDGSYKGDNFGDLNPSPYAGHTTEADNEMRLVKFHRAGAEDVLLCNWQTHPHRTGGSRKYDISADIVGVMRDELKAALGCKFIYFSGAGGNVNPRSRIARENVTADYLEQGKALARYALDAERGYEPLALSAVRVEHRKIWADLNRPDPKLLEGSRLVFDHWLKTNDFRACCEMAAPYGINSPYAAGNFIRRSECKDAGYYYPFTAISLGDLAFVSVPYEMFDTNAKYVREQSPFKLTVVASCCNDANGYVPSAYGYIHGCYEADCSLCKPGSGERFAYAMVRMLEDLKK